MWDIKKQILDASISLNIQVKEIDNSTKAKILMNVGEKYLINEMKFPLWERLNDAKSKSDDKAWQWVEDFIGEESTILFFNPSDEKNAYLLNSGNDIVSILGEMYNVEFYLTNEEASYLLCFNHHDVLLALGEAKEWLQEYKN